MRKSLCVPKNYSLDSLPRLPIVAQFPDVKNMIPSVKSLGTGGEGNIFMWRGNYGAYRVLLRGALFLIREDQVHAFREHWFLTQEDSSPHVTACISGKVLESQGQRLLQAYLNIRYVSQRGNGMEKSNSALFSCLSTKQSKQMSLDKWKSIRLKRPLSFNWFKLSG